MAADSSGGVIAAGQPPSQVPFQASVELLHLFLKRREAIVEDIEALLNAQRRPLRYLQDQSLLSRNIEDCFYARAAAAGGQIRPEGRLPRRAALEEAHWAGGFRPRPVRDLHNDLIHPAEMMIRAFYCWRQTRWPGRNGRLHYAHTLFNLYVLRWLQLMSMRLWDAAPSAEGPGGATAGARLAELQRLLDELWKSSPAGQPAIVCDARWLIPLAQSLITDELAPYFEAARQVTESLPEPDVVEIWKAHVRMLGGHLTSQIRHYCTRDGLSIDDPRVVLRTRASNALDFALLVHGLVVLLKAYEGALRSGDARMRLEMAGAIFQGLSADPELFLNRVNLLSAYSMIEHVFVVRQSEDPEPETLRSHAVYSPLGQRHVGLLNEYGVWINRLIEPLRDDFPRFKPVPGAWSTYGVIFGLPSHLIEHMALKAMQHDAETRFGLEDIFDDTDVHAAKLAWMNGWRQLPHIAPEVQHLYDYPQPFAEDVYSRIQNQLDRRQPGSAAYGGSKTGHLYVVSADAPDPDMDLQAAAVAELPARYFGSSDRQFVAARKAEPYDRAQLLAGRQEGHFLVSYETQGGWTALKKDLLTEVLGEGRDARIGGLPAEAAEVLRLMCLGLALPAHERERTSGPSSSETA